MDEQFKIDGEKAENEIEEYAAPTEKQINYTETTVALPKKKRKVRRWKFFVAIVGIVALAQLSYLAWNNYLSPQAKSNREAQKAYDAYLKYINQYETAMKNDTYGGQTPQETLDMFVDALKKGDVELASKYFVLREDGSRNPEILSILKTRKENGSLSEIISIAESLKPSFEMNTDNSYIFIVPNNQGMAQYSMFLNKNQYSQLWKIESM